MPTSDQERRENIRHELLALLAGTPSLKFSAATIQRRLARENDFTLAEVLDGLIFLTDAKLLKSEPDALGSTVYYQMTAAGSLQYERSL